MTYQHRQSITPRFYSTICFVCALGMTNAWALDTTADATSKKPGFIIDSYHVLPEAQFSAYYDDNIYATESGQVDDYVGVTTGTLKIKSLWAKNSLQANAGYSHGEYLDNDSENYDDAWIDFNGRYEIDPKTNLYGGAGYYRKHEGRDSKESSASGDEPTVYDFWNIQLGGRHQIGDYTVRLVGTYDEWDYEDIMQTVVENNVQNEDQEEEEPQPAVVRVKLDNDFRNRVQTGLALRVSRGLDKQTDLYVQGMFNNRNYESQDLEGVNRDSYGYNVSAGVIRKFGSKDRIQAYVGGLYQEYEDFDSVEALDFGFNLRWYPADGYKLTGNLTRTLGEATETGVSGYLYTNLNLQLDKRIITNYVGTVTLDYGDVEYKGANGWDEDFYSVGLGVSYYMSPHMFFTTSYSHAVNASEEDGYSYHKNLILISFKAKLAP